MQDCTPMLSASRQLPSYLVQLPQHGAIVDRTADLDNRSAQDRAITRVACLDFLTSQLLHLGFQRAFLRVIQVARSSDLRLGNPQPLIQFLLERANDLQEEGDTPMIHQHRHEVPYRPGNSFASYDRIQQVTLLRGWNGRVLPDPPQSGVPFHQ